MNLAPVFAALILIAAAVWTILWARRQRVLGGLPEGELVYADDADARARPLISLRYGLKGKPDALVRLPSGGLVPVERKKATAPRQPYEGDIIQASAYCVLVEEEYGHSPPFMRIQYADRHFDVAYTSERKQWVLDSCRRVRTARQADACKRSHRIAAKCRNCAQRLNCNQILQTP